MRQGSVSTAAANDAPLDDAEPGIDGGLDDVAPKTVPTDRLGWRTLLAGAIGALVLTFIQAPGKIVDDTKLPLLMRPTAYLGDLMHLWNPTQYSGFLQPGTFGYLFPMGPFFALGQALHIPVWITERVWLALLLTVAFWGVVRLAEALGIGSPSSRVIGGVAYAVAPIVIIYSTTSAALLATVLLPWALVPLVRGMAGGSPRKAAAASGIAIALMSGVNATLVFAVLIPPAIWLITRRPGPRRRALMGWWVIAALCACVWYVAATYIEAKFGYNYLPYTETAVNTTATTSLFEAVRGASFWTGYLTFNGPQIPGIWALISTTIPSLGASVVAALGLIGLSRRGIPERLFLVATFFVGVVVIAVGYDGPLGSPLAHAVQNLLDSHLAPFRNVSKFSPDVALPVALGLAWLVTAVSWRSLVQPLRRGIPRTTAAFRWTLGIVTVAALVAASAPFWQAKLYPSGGFSAIPSYWSATAKWLDHHQDHGTALLVPGSTFAKYTWGRPIDEPLAVLMSSQFSVRSIAPFGSDGNDGVMDAVDASLNSGVAEPGMAAYLARAGYDYVVVRNDLNLSATGAPPPAQVQQVLSETTGLRLVATFGPVISLSQAASGSLSVYDSVTADRHLRSVAIYKVLPSVPAVRTYATSNPVVVSGSTGNVLPLVAAGLLDNRASLLAGDPHGGAAATKAQAATWADTDGNQRRDQAFGIIQNNFSYVLGPGQRTSSAIPHIPENLAVVRGASHQTVAAPLGAASVSASSYGSTTLALDPAEGPAAAFEGVPSQAWVADNVNDSVNQWIQINFKHKIDLSTIKVRPLAQGPTRPIATKIAISTEQGTVDRRIGKGENTIHVSAGSTTWMRITLIHVSPATKIIPHFIPLGAGISNVTIPGIHFQSALRLPSDEASAFSGRNANDLVYSFSAPLDDANLFLGVAPDDDPKMIRQFTVPKATTLSITGTATPTPSPAIANFIPRPSSTLKVSATSTLGNLPRFGPDNLVIDSGRPWIAALDDTSPAITLSWTGGERRVDSINLDLSSEAARPRDVVVTTIAGSTTVAVPRTGGIIKFPPVVTNEIILFFQNPTKKKSVIPGYNLSFDVPVGLKNVSIPALGDTTAPTASTTPRVIPCGFGPTIRIDGMTLKTTLSGTVGDIEALRPMALSVCGGPVRLSAGNHLLNANEGTNPFKVTSLLARPQTPAAGTSTRSARVVGKWTAVNHKVDVGPGSQSYLVVAQNYNSGWRATLSGRTLTAARIDGWQQAFVVPAGSGGTVTMTFAPDTEYHAVLVLGAITLIALLLLLLWRRRRSALASAGPIEIRNAIVLSLVSLVLLALVVGPLALIFVPLLVVGILWGPNVTSWTAGAAFLAAGIVVAASAGAEPGTKDGAFSVLAQLASAVALAALAASVVVADREPRFSRRRAKREATTVTDLTGGGEEPPADGDEDKMATAGSRST
jgi:arabinofuranan 3-O-arabinosyltransferase